MSRFNQIANSEQDPLIVHSKDLAVLLPHRPPNISPIDRNTFRQLYQALTCIICRQLFQSPVLLRCSHRFCRACIEHRIRSTNKKYCPTCNAPLLTKRELRSDDFTLDFIDVVFGNLSFSGETKLENAELQAMMPEQKTRIFRTRRTCRRRPGHGESEATEGLPVKRTRKIKEQPDQSIQINKSQLLQNIHLGEDGENEAQKSNTSEAQQTVKNEIQVKIEEGKKQKSQESVQASMEISYFSSESNNNQQTEQNLQGSLSSNTSQQSSKTSTKSIKDICQQICIRISLMVHPQKYTTPLLDFSEIECSTKARAKSIFDLLTKEFNLIEGQYIELYVSVGGNLQKVSPNQTLAALNQQYWRAGQQIGYLDWATRLDSYSEEAINDGASSQEANPANGVLYYSVEFLSNPVLIPQSKERLHPI